VRTPPALPLFAVWVLLSGAETVSAADDVAALFRDANARYREKDYAAAARMYRQIAAAGVRDGAVEFNLGNALFRGGNLGEAILHYERAHRLMPRNRDVLQNLRLARRQREDQVEESERNAVVRFFHGIASSLTVNEWSVVASVVLFLLGGILSARTLVTGPDMRRRLRHLAVVLAAAFVWSAASAAFQFEQLRRPVAIILSPELELYSEPNPPAEEGHLFLLHEGSRVDIVRSEGEWALVRYAPGLRGWCREEHLARI